MILQRARARSSDSIISVLSRKDHVLLLHLDERSTQFRRSAPGREIAAGEPVEVQHPFQRSNVGGNIQRIGGKQLVQLVFKGGDEQIHAPLNALLCLSDVGALHILCRELGVGVQQLQPTEFQAAS